MPNEATYSEILRDILTTKDLEILMDEIDVVRKNLYKKEPVEIRSKILVSDEEFLKGLTKKLESLKTVKLTLAISPKTATLRKLADWARVNLGEGIILDIEVEKSILGGAIVSFGGRYQDFSLKSKLDIFFK